MMAPLKLGIVILAAGLSTRLEGENKLLRLWGGKALVGHVFALATALPAHQKAVITHRDRSALLDLLVDADVWLKIQNPDSAKGMASSLRLGLAAMTDCDGVLVMLGDMPDISPLTLANMAGGLTGDTYAIVPTYQGQWGNPVLLGPQAMMDCASLLGDQGARKLLVSQSHRVTLIAVDDPAILVDFDVRTDFNSRDATF